MPCQRLLFLPLSIFGQSEKNGSQEVRPNGWRWLKKKKNSHTVMFKEQEYYSSQKDSLFTISDALETAEVMLE